MVKNSPASVGDTGSTGSIPGSGRSSGVGNSNPLPGKFHGQRSLADYSPWGCKESDTTELLSTHAHSQLLTWLNPLLHK